MPKSSVRSSRQRETCCKHWGFPQCVFCVISCRLHAGGAPRPDNMRYFRRVFEHIWHGQSPDVCCMCEHSKIDKILIWFTGYCFQIYWALVWGFWNLNPSSKFETATFYPSTTKGNYGNQNWCESFLKDIKYLQLKVLKVFIKQCLRQSAYFH